MADAEHISEWMKQQVVDSGLDGIAVGLSGGIDSSVVAVLAKQAMGNDMIGVIMPCGSDPEDAEHALLLAKRFDIGTEFVDLTLPYASLREQFPEGSDLAAANLKPRLRMLTLYYIANARNYLVAGTGNRTELAVGYFTKYGDGGVDILPIGSLLKVEVRELAGEIDIPEEIINKPPSAGLWKGQTDEEEMGITYEELDRIVARAEKGDFTPRTKTEEKVVSMMNRSQHKKKLPLVCDPEQG